MATKPENIPDICRASEHDEGFYDKGREWLWAFVQFGSTTSAFLGTRKQVDAFNRHLARVESSSYFVDIANSPELAPAAKRPG